MDNTMAINKHGGKILSICIAGGLLAVNSLAGPLGLIPLTIPPLLAAGGIVAGGTFIDLLHRENKYEKIFRLCGIVNKDNQVPLVIKNTETDGIRTLVVHMPAGLSQKHFEQKQQELEQNLNCKITYGFNKNLILTLAELNLKNEYDYIFESCKDPLKVFIGYSHTGKIYLDISKAPHMIISGAANWGKSSILDCISLSLNLSPHKICLHYVDFQGVGLGKYEDCKKTKTYCETPEQFERLLDHLEEIQRERLALFRSVKHKVFIDKLSTWNHMFPERALPYNIVLGDEFQTLADKRYEPILDKLRDRVAKDRKIGTHYALAFQRPDTTVIAGNIKDNMPCRIGFKCASDVDSRVAMGIEGAGCERLTTPGRFMLNYCGELIEGHALYMPSEKIRDFLIKNNCFKTPEDKKVDRERTIKEFRKKNINPYRKELKEN